MAGMSAWQTLGRSVAWKVYFYEGRLTLIGGEDHVRKADHKGSGVPRPVCRRPFGHEQGVRSSDAIGS